MFISEIFYSIQGEGCLVGVPSVFVRSSGCNLRCRWCDTPYASWQPEGTEMTIEAILESVAQHPAKHVVVTGGEPMIAKGIRTLLTELRGAGYHITIETAGTVAPLGVPCDLASVSPKLANSTPTADAGAWVARHEATRLVPETLSQWLDYSFQLKFVVSTQSDLLRIQEVIDSLDRPIPSDRILVMPEGTSSEAIQSRQALLVEACLRHGWRYTPRLHIDLFGNRRGT